MPAGAHTSEVILAAGTFDEGAHPRIRVVLEGLEAHGFAVERIVEPLGFATAQRVAVLQNPTRLPQLGVAVGRAWARLVPRLRERRHTSPRPAAVVVGHLGHFDVGLVGRLTRPVPLVFDFLISGQGTATDRGAAGGIRHRVLGRLDRWALAHADVVMVDTPEHLISVPDRFRQRAVVVPVGADERWFNATKPAVRPTDRLKVVFFGLFTPLQGAAVVAEALRLLDGQVDATVIGSGQQSAEVDQILAGVPAVTRLGWVEPDALPAVVAGHDVCLGIFGSTAKALAVVPNKVYQGAAAGTVVITSDTTPQRRMMGEHGVYVEPGSPEALAEALRMLASSPDEVAWRRKATADHAARTFRSSEVVRPLLDRLTRET